MPQGLFQARSLLTEDYGSIFMHIGPIISLHDVCQQLSVSRVPHALIPRFFPTPLFLSLSELNVQSTDATTFTMHGHLNGSNGSHNSSLEGARKLKFAPF